MLTLVASVRSLPALLLTLTLGLVLAGVVPASARGDYVCKVAGHGDHVHPALLAPHDAALSGHENTDHLPAAVGGDHDGCIGASAWQHGGQFGTARRLTFAHPAWFGAAAGRDAFPPFAGELHRPPNA